VAVLAGKVAVVTGASSGIGRATARLFAREGAAVVVTARREAELDRLVAEIERDGGRAVAVAGDVREVSESIVDTAVRRFGGLDIGFNNAGTPGPMVPTHTVAPADWDEVIGTNLTAAFLGAKHQVPALVERGGGSLIFTSSFVGHTAGLPGMGAYAASKAGVIGLTKVLAAELGPAAIRVNAVLPGGTDTAMNAARAPGAAPGTQEYVESLHALKRLAEPEEIARTVLHLASDAASFITGTALLVDGGVSISRP
jgi:NAD(P)-dependent dehydrogenase (short-subunit alcohol dehydrogenase family)